MGELGTLLEQATKALKLKTTKNLWFPISKFNTKTYNFEPMMVASRNLINPIFNPHGAGFAWYHQGSDEFIVSVADLDDPGVRAELIPRTDVTHFILIEGPY